MGNAESGIKDGHSGKQTNEGYNKQAHGRKHSSGHLAPLLDTYEKFQLCKDMANLSIGTKTIAKKNKLDSQSVIFQKVDGSTTPNRKVCQKSKNAMPKKSKKRTASEPMEEDAVAPAKMRESCILASTPYIRENHSPRSRHLHFTH